MCQEKDSHILISFLLYILCLIYFSIKGIEPLESSLQILLSKIKEKNLKKNVFIINNIKKDIKENPVKKKINSINLNSETKRKKQKTLNESRKYKIKQKTSKQSLINISATKNNFSLSSKIKLEL